MAPKKDNVQVEKKENGLSHEKEIIDSWKTRCNVMKRSLLKKFPHQSEEIEKVFNDLKEFELEAAGEVMMKKYALEKNAHNIGDVQKRLADDFARKMGRPLDEVRGQGVFSTRKIAEKFNELGIKSQKGGLWSHSAVSGLLRRRKELGLE